MKLLGRQAVHGKYGAGTVTDLNNDVLRVFFDQSGSRAFRYPDVFRTDLRLEDPELQKKLMQELTEE